MRTNNAMRVLYMSGGVRLGTGALCRHTPSCPRALYVPEYPSSADSLTCPFFLFPFSSLPRSSLGILLSKEGHRARHLPQRGQRWGLSNIVVNQSRGRLAQRVQTFGN